MANREPLALYQSLAEHYLNGKRLTDRLDGGRRGDYGICPCGLGEQRSGELSKISIPASPLRGIPVKRRAYQAWKRDLAWFPCQTVSLALT